MSNSTRQLEICTFAHEKATTPKKVGTLPWDVIAKLHERRHLRPQKSGAMIGGYAIIGTRADRNVPYRSLIQVDIDTVGEKDDHVPCRGVADGVGRRAFPAGPG